MDSRGRRALRRKIQDLPVHSLPVQPVEAILLEKPKVKRRGLLWETITAVVAGFLLIAAAYLATHGTWQIFPSGLGFVRYYDFQGAALLEGRWDVPLEALAGEATIHAGKSYGYFGFAPALPRILLNSLFPAFFGRWSSISMILALGTLILAFLSLSRLIQLPAPFRPFLMLVAIGGSTALFLCASYMTYHEAIMWGATLSICAYLCLGWYLRTTQFRYLALAALLGAGGFFSRLTSGAGVLACMALIALGLMLETRGERSPRFKQALDWLNFPRPRSPMLHGAFLLLYVMAITAGFVGINHAKFGTYLDQSPIRYNIQYGPDRIQRIHGTMLHPEYVAFNAANYLDPRHIEINSKYPYLHLTSQTEKSGFQMDQVEPYAAFTVAMPALFTLSVAGAAGLFRGDRKQGRPFLLVLASTLLVGLGLLAFAAISYRYQHDWYPFFFFASMLGADRVARMPFGLGRVAALVALGLAGVWSLWANYGFVCDLRHSGLFGW